MPQPALPCVSGVPVPATAFAGPASCRPVQSRCAGDGSCMCSPAQRATMHHISRMQARPCSRCRVLPWKLSVTAGRPAHSTQVVLLQSLPRCGGLSLHHPQAQLGHAHGGRVRIQPASAGAGRPSRPHSRRTPGEQSQDASSQCPWPASFICVSDFCLMLVGAFHPWHSLQD